MRKSIFGYMRPTKAQSSLHIRAVWQRLHCPLKETLDTTECMNGQQRPGWYVAYVQGDVNPLILHILEGMFSLNEANSNLSCAPFLRHMSYL